MQFIQLAFHSNFRLIHGNLKNNNAQIGITVAARAPKNTDKT